jgi:dTDP-glucose 4,6-dehydratase
LGVRRLLVTGGAGFIGANFVHHLLGQGSCERVVVLDALTYAGNLASLDGVSRRAEFRFVHGNICDRQLVESLLRDESIDTVVHFAAESHVDRSIVASDAFVRTNIMGTHALLEACRQVWLSKKPVPRHRFHHVSTDEVYGSLAPEDPAFSEQTPYAPNSPYSASKAGSDHLVRAYTHTYGLSCTISNCSNNYGPYQFPEKLIPLMIVNMLEGKSLPIYGDGRNVRDWLLVTDHCRAIEAILTRGRPGETYNIGGKAECENLTLVRMLCQLTHRIFRERPELSARYPKCPAAQGAGLDSLIMMVADRPGHDRRYAIDGRKIERDLDFTPSMPLEQGLNHTIEWFLENESWWRGVMDGSYREWVDGNYRERLAAHAVQGEVNRID